jgi:hypothetical protein
VGISRAYMQHMSASGWPASYPLLQPPNTAATVAWSLRAVAAASGGRTREVALAGHYVALAVWAYLELADGDNAVRRAVGALTLARLGARAGKALAAWDR